MEKKKRKKKKKRRKEDKTERKDPYSTLVIRYFIISSGIAKAVTHSFEMPTQTSFRPPTYVSVQDPRPIPFMYSGEYRVPSSKRSSLRQKKKGKKNLRCHLEEKTKQKKS